MLLGHPKSLTNAPHFKRWCNCGFVFKNTVPLSLGTKRLFRGMNPLLVWLSIKGLKAIIGLGSAAVSNYLTWITSGPKVNWLPVQLFLLLSQRPGCFPSWFSFSHSLHLRWWEREWLPKAHRFKYLVTREWNYLKGLEGFGRLEQGYCSWRKCITESRLSSSLSAWWSGCKALGYFASECMPPCS